MDRVLVVEDDTAILRGLQDNLRSEPYEVLTASDGETAYRLIRDERPDLVVLDVMLPRLSGIALCRRVRSEGLTTPILMLTAQEQEQDRVAGLDAGADDYVTKPFLLKELLARVRGLLRHRREWRGEHQQLDRDVRSAADVQRRLLPQAVPAFANAECAAFCEPALGIGGDYYDFITLSPTLTGLVLADVAGKGITAALTMASFQGTLRVEAPRYGRRAADLVAAMNNALYGTLPPGRFVTCFYAVWDDVNRSLTYVNAGHPPPVLIHAHRSMTSLDACVPPLGLFASMTPQDATICTEPGDWLLAFSDGVTEAVGVDHVEFGRDGLLEAARNQVGRRADDMCEAIQAAVRLHAAGRPQLDDVTLMVARIV